MANSFVNSSNIVSASTYGAILIPLKKQEEKEPATAKQKNSLKGKLKTALSNATDTIKQGFNNTTQEIKTAVNSLLNGDISKVTPIMSKFSGIAIAQTIMNGNITSKEAADYLFMGFAPALGIQGSLMGYSGLNQIKDALTNGHVNVGEFVNGLAKVIKGANDLFKQNKDRDINSKYQIIEIDLTISHNETYQSETPDRRVQSGQTLNEYIHNLPVTIDMQCALQENKRYSQSEFRAIMEEIRKNKQTVLLQLGDEQFEDLVLTDFSPTSDCTKSGYDYNLSFKKILWSDIDTSKQVTIQKIPIKLEENISIGGLGKNNVNMPDIKPPKNVTKEDFMCKPEDIQVTQYEYNLSNATILDISKERLGKKQ